MARSNFCIAFILLSIVTLVAADVYNYDQKPDRNSQVVKPMEKEQPTVPKADYMKPKTEGNNKFFENKLPSYEQPKPYEKENIFPSKVDNEKPKTEGNRKFLYGKLPHYEQPKPEEKKEKLTVPSKVYYEKPKKDENEQITDKYSHYEQQPKQEQEKEKYVPTKQSYEENKYEAPSSVSVKGLVYCKTGPKFVPLPGAVAKVTCLAVDKITYKSISFSVLSKPCDSEGYFLAEITQKYGWSIEECRVYLDYSPSETCAVPTNANNGINGDLFSFAYQTLGPLINVKHVSVGPFFYTTPAQTYSNPPVTNANNGY